MIRTPRKARDVPVTFELKAWYALQCLPADVRERVIERLAFLSSRDDHGRYAREVVPGFVAVLERSRRALRVLDLFGVERLAAWPRLDERPRSIGEQDLCT
jgi:hypothetical protein